MTLWVFGDSFATEYWRKEPDFPYYYRTVADRLATDCVMCGRGGSSAEYTYDQFYKNKANIKQDDVVLIALTTTIRRWFFPTRPSLTSFWSIEAKPHEYTEQELRAFEQYMLHLDHQLLFDLAMTNFLYALELFASRQKVKTIVMPCFPDVVRLVGKLDLSEVKLAKGNLWYVNRDEYSSDLNNKMGLIINDGKPNHLTATNHKRLAEKLLRTIENNDPLDLTTGFVKGTYTSESIKDPEYKKRELGDANIAIEIRLGPKTA